MNTKLASIKKFLMVFVLLVSLALLAGCGGSDGKDGATGPAGPQGPAGPEGPAGPPGQDLTAVAEPESCAICHADVGEKNHQSIYDKYIDASNLAMQITSVKSTSDGKGGYDVAMTVSITKNGMPFTEGLASLDQHSFYVQGYDNATRSFPNAMNKSLSYTTATVVSPGVYKLTATGVSYAPENSNAFAYAYIAKDRLDTEIAGHYNLYDNLASAGKAFGNVGSYESYANVEGCQKCHGTPYRKHGYREAVVAGLPTFSSCKACHMDDRAGGHQDWQQIVDDPVAWGNGDPASANPQYAYTRRIMNDVHMSHAMEFPYPQTMANCTTCHAGKMDKVTADEFFEAATCKSCHGVKSRPDEYNALSFYAKRAPSLEDIWVEKNVAFHSIDDNCFSCHGNGVGKSFSEIHTGYNPMIYNASGEKYTDLYKAEITSVSMADGKVDIRFTANTALMTEPSVLVSWYGYDTKQFIVSSHSRDADRNRLGEYTIGGSSPYFTEEADSVQGNWHVTMDANALPADVGVADMIASGAIKRLEVSIRPTVVIDDVTVATNGVSKTLVLASNSIDDNYFKGANAVVDVEGCNACHDALATTFHSADRGGDITLCKHCHVPSSGGSHLEMQSREIASYVHAIHKFQAFDPEEINFADPVEANIYGLHIEHTFPNFTIKNCEACHLEGVFNVPDQSQSLPAVLSASVTNDAGPDGADTWNRNIGDVPSYVVGPASKACGGCHRAEIINEDLAGELAAFNQHTKAGGYLIENEDGTWEQVVDKIMGMFK